METTKVKKYTFFIGIDVSRNKLDYAIMQGKYLLYHKESHNNPESILEFVEEVKSIKGFTMTKVVFCMEQTGIYCNHLLNCLKRLKANVVLENAVQIRNSMGVIRNKTDKIDAIRIAQYAYKSRDELRLWVPKRIVVQELAALITLRNRLVDMQTTVRAPLKEEEDFVRKSFVKQSNQLCHETLKSLKGDIANVNDRIDELIASDTSFTRLVEIITSIPSIGLITAINFIVTTNEFKDIRTPKKFACYAGVAPFLKESGMAKGKPKVSNMANKKIKTLLHICALTAFRTLPDIKEYYRRKTEDEGKSKMATLNAVRNKLIHRVYACVHQNRPYEKIYSGMLNLSPK